MPVLERRRSDDDRLTALEVTTGRLEVTTKQTASDIGEIKTTLNKMLSDDMAELKRRAELPGILLRAISVPVFAGIIVTIALGVLHLG